MNLRMLNTDKLRLWGNWIKDRFHVTESKVLWKHKVGSRRVESTLFTKWSVIKEQNKKICVNLRRDLSCAIMRILRLRFGKRWPEYEMQEAQVICEQFLSVSWLL
jgi:hypothetical protein